MCRISPGAVLVSKLELADADGSDQGEHHAEEPCSGMTTQVSTGQGSQKPVEAHGQRTPAIMACGTDAKRPEILPAPTGQLSSCAYCSLGFLQGVRCIHRQLHHGQT